VTILPDASTEHVYGGLSLFNGGVYLVTASMCDQNTYHGRIAFVDASTNHPKITHAFYTDGTTVRGGKVISYGSGGGGIWGPGGVSIDAADGSVYVATGNLLNSASEHDHFGDQVVKLDSALNVLDSNYPGLPDPEADVDFGSTAVLFQAGSCPASFAAINKDRLFFTYARANLAQGPLQQFDNNSDVGDVAFDAANRQLLVANLDSVQAWRYDSGCNASLAWSTASTSGPGGELGQSISPPTVANGVVYYGNGAGRMLEAFNARTGRRLLKLKLPGSIFAAPTVVNGHVYVADWAGYLTAFEPAA
jgi:outer membrane protein assembly factor BamB